MTRRERCGTPSALVCCVCDRPLSLLDVETFYGSVDEELHGEVYCPDCMEVCLSLCRECSCRYTAREGVCGECLAREYPLAG
jgi:hypothetical protein